MIRVIDSAILMSMGSIFSWSSTAVQYGEEGICYHSGSPVWSSLCILFTVVFLDYKVQVIAGELCWTPHDTCYLFSFWSIPSFRWTYFVRAMPHIQIFVSSYTCPGCLKVSAVPNHWIQWHIASWKSTWVYLQIQRTVIVHRVWFRKSLTGSCGPVWLRHQW